MHVVQEALMALFLPLKHGLINPKLLLFLYVNLQSLSFSTSHLLKDFIFEQEYVIVLRRRSNFIPVSCFASNSMEKMRSSAFFNVPGLLLGFAGKGSPESDSVKSPTSPLDHRIFSGTSFALRSPGRSWDCSRVGLGLLDSLSNSNSPSNPESKNILLRIAGKKTPKPSNSSSNPARPDFSPSNSYEKIEPYPTDSIYQNPNPSARGSISAREIELSEDYTCIISHGPNPKTTHIFGDCVLENSLIEILSSQKKEEDEDEEGSHWIVNCIDNSSSSSLRDFLSFCCSCKKMLEVGKDIYMYRGEKAFCSSGCREQAMIFDGDELGIEKPGICSRNSPRSSFHEEHFL